MDLEVLDWGWKETPEWRVGRVGPWESGATRRLQILRTERNKKRDGPRGNEVQLDRLENE